MGIYFSVLLLNSYQEDNQCKFEKIDDIEIIYEMLKKLRILPLNSLSDLIDWLNNPRFLQSKKIFHTLINGKVKEFSDFYSLIRVICYSCRTPQTHYIIIELPQNLKNKEDITRSVFDAKHRINGVNMNNNSNGRIGVIWSVS